MIYVSRVEKVLFGYFKFNLDSWTLSTKLFSIKILVQTVFLERLIDLFAKLDHIFSNHIQEMWRHILNISKYFQNLKDSTKNVICGKKKLSKMFAITLSNFKLNYFFFIYSITVFCLLCIKGIAGDSFLKFLYWFFYALK